MPHAVVEGEVDLPSWARGFRPILVRLGSDVLRAERVYLETQGRAVLIEALVVEAGRKLPFYVKISASGRSSATVRIDPTTHPERSEGVRRLVAEVVADLIARTPGCRLAKGTVLLPSPPDGGDPA